MRVAALALAGLLLVSGCTSGGSGPASPASAAPSAGASSPSAPPRPTHLRVRRLGWRLPQPLGREAVVGQAAGAPVVVAGGLLAGNASSPASYTLDLANGHVTTLPDLPVDVHDTAGVLLGGRTLVLGGGNASEQAVVQVRRGGRWRVDGRLPTARSDLSAVVANGRAYVVGGYDGSSPALGDVLVSRDGRSWRVAAHLRLPVRYAATALVGGSLWVLGGERNGAMVDAVQRIDLATGRVRLVGRLPRPLGHAAAVVLGGRVLLVGGRTGPDSVTDLMQWFSPASRRFTRAGRLPTGLADSTPVAAGPDTAFLVGGETPALTDRVVRLALN
ncbi:MAG: hypothetical protein ABIQ59_07000 [Nocardioidaceae bacterium]